MAKFCPFTDDELVALKLHAGTERKADEEVGIAAGRLLALINRLELAEAKLDMVYQLNELGRS